MEKLKLLDRLLSSLTLWVSPGVTRELGVDTEIGQIIITSVTHVTDELFEHCLTVDEEVVLLAQKKGLAIISEDRKILQKAELLTLPAYPSGIIIGFLVYKGILSIDEAQVRWEEMRLNYPYRKDLDSYCNGFLTYLRRSL